MKTINELCAYIKKDNLDAPEFLEMLNAFLKNEVNGAHKYGFLLLRSAIFRAHIPTINLLMQHANVVQADDKGITLLMSAAAKGHVEVMQLLLDRLNDPADKRAYVNLQSHRGNTALHIAAMSLTAMNEDRALETIRFLLQNGADPTLIDDIGDIFVALTSVRAQSKLVQFSDASPTKRRSQEVGKEGAAQAGVYRAKRSCV